MAALDVAYVGLEIVVPSPMVIAIATCCESLAASVKITHVRFNSKMHSHVLLQVSFKFEGFVANSPATGTHIDANKLLLVVYYLGHMFL